MKQINYKELIFLVLIGPCLLGVFAAACLGILYLRLSSCDITTFDSQRFKFPGETFGWPNDRSCMLDDLISRYQLVGLNKDQVVALLGEPIPKNVAYQYDKSLEELLGKHSMVYGLQALRYFVIDLDSNQKVVSYSPETLKLK